MRKLLILIGAAAVAAYVAASDFATAADTVKDLSGTWRVTGEGFSGDVRLPGTLADAKLGRHMTAEDWEKDTDRRSKGALTREWQYRGKAVYERAFELTEAEAKHPLELVLERVMLHSEVEIDGEAVGSCDSLAVAHVYPIPQRLTKAGRHTIRLMLDNSNRYNFSEWSHSYGPVMQSVWHGVVGELALRRQSPLRQARVFASWPANGKVLVEVPDGFEAREGNMRIAGLAASVASVKPSPCRKGFNLVELKLDREPEPWSEHHPNIYTLTLRDEAADFTHTIRFGFRSVSAHDHAIWINGDKWFMRGNLDCCHFPLTGAPDTTKAWWRETFRRLRDEDGINTIRFHSWTPPKAAFDVADEMGMQKRGPISLGESAPWGVIYKLQKWYNAFLQHMAIKWYGQWTTCLASSAGGRCYGIMSGVKAKKILFVCHGNICRSPMAEFVMKKLLADVGVSGVEVESAALHTDEIGSDIHRGTRAKLVEKGVPFERRRAWLLTAEKAHGYDLLIGCDAWNKADLLRLVRPEDEGRVRLLMEFAGESRDIADPWYTGDFDATYADVLKGCTALLARLTA